MNIGILTTSYFPEYTGASLRVDGLARGLHSYGYKVSIFAPGETFSKEPLPYGVLYRIPVRRNRLANFLERYTKFNFARYFAFSHALPSLLREEKICLIHARQPLDFFLIGHKMKKMMSLVFVVEAHKLLGLTDYENKQIPFFLKSILLACERKGMNRSDLVITMTSSGLKTLRTHGVTPPVVIVHNASTLQAPSRGVSPLPNVKYVFYAGNLRDVEGIDHLLDSFLLMKNTIPGLKCVLAGGGDIKKWKSYAKNIGLALDTIFLGEVPQKKLATYYQHALLFAYPRKNLTYHHDIIGLKIYDALRMGVPIVTSDVGELGELIRKEGVGLTSRPEDNSDFARTALTLLTDEKLYARIKKNVARLQHHFDWETACKPLAQTYDSLLREKRRK